jgi:replicative DNA helicase
MVDKILNGATFPSRRQTQALSSWFLGESDAIPQDVESALAKMSQLWHKAEVARLNAADNPRREDAENHSGAPRISMVDPQSEFVNSTDSPKSDEESAYLAERNVIGAMLLSVDAVADVVEVVKAEDFQGPLNQEIFRCIVDLYRADPASVGVDLVISIVSKSALWQEGSARYIHEIVTSAPDPRLAETYAEIVSRQALMRELVAAGQRISNLGRETHPGTQEDVETLIDAADEEVKRLITRFTIVEDEGYRWERIFDTIEAAGSVPRPLRGLPSGLRDLDTLIGGFRPGQLTVIGSATGAGRSTFVANIARTCAVVHKFPVVIFSFEADEDEISKRMLAAEAKVPLARIDAGQLTDDDWLKIARRVEDVTGAPLHVRDEPDMNLEDIARISRRLRRQQNLRLVLVDTIQALDMQDPPATRDVTLRIQQLSGMAKSLQVPVIVASRMDYSAFQGHRPTLANIATPLVEAADVVIIIHREDLYDMESPRAGEADIFVAKNRSGPTGVVTTAFQGHYARFVDMQSI